MSDDKYAANLERYEKLVATNPDVKRKGKTMPYTSVNGHMFSLLGKEGKLGLRLPKEERDAFLAEFETEPFVQYGAVMKEYVVVPDDLLKKTETLKKYFFISYEYVGSLKTKPTYSNDTCEVGCNALAGLMQLWWPRLWRSTIASE